MFQIKTSRQTASWATRPYHHLSIFSETKCTMSPFRLTVPPSVSLYFSPVRTRNISFSKTCRPAREKKNVDPQRDANYKRLVHFCTTTANKRPKKIFSIFFQREHKKYSKCNGPKFPKTSISVPATPKRRTPPRRSIARSPSRDSRHGEATAINSVIARREAKMSSGPSLHGEQGEP